MNAVAAIIGMGFGAMLVFSGMADYDVIHDGLLFRSPHLYLMMAAAIATGAPLLWLLQRRRLRTLLGGELAVSRDEVKPQQIKGGLLFGAGWAVAGTCPGAVAAMAATGRAHGLLVMVGIGAGVFLRDALESRPAPTGAGQRIPSASWRLRT